MLHQPASPSGKDHASMAKARIGAWMFLIYALLYAGFVAINVIDPLLMERPVVLGLNLAVTYGMGLILFALLLALIYNRMCVLQEMKRNLGRDGKGE
jgi:uncharacterized membrane protein (DUF485 family)